MYCRGRSSVLMCCSTMGCFGTTAERVRQLSTTRMAFRCIPNRNKTHETRNRLDFSRKRCRMDEKRRRFAFQATLSDRTPLTLNVGETSVCIPFSCEEAKTFQDLLQHLFILFKEKAENGQRKRLESMEYVCNGTLDNGDDLFVEVFCNPNAYPDAFQAKALITIKTKAIRITTEGRISAIKSDMDSFVETHA